MSFHRVRTGANGPEWSILYDVVGRGTAWLSRRKPGDRVYGWGPLGRGYEIGHTSRNLLLVAGGIGVAPLVWLADEAVAKRLSVTMIVGARDAEHVFPSHLLPPEVEVVVTTDDGSAGRKGFVTEPFGELLEWCDQAFACGPNAMMQAMAAVARASKTRRIAAGAARRAHGLRHGHLLRLRRPGARPRRPRDEARLQRRPALRGARHLVILGAP